MDKQKTLPTCEEFYDFHKKFAEKKEMELNSLLKALETSPRDNYCNDAISCNKTNYCVSGMLVNYDGWIIKPNGIQTCEDLYELQDMVSKMNNWDIEEVRKVAQVPIGGEGGEIC